MTNDHPETEAIRLVHLADIHLGFHTSLNVEEGRAAAGRPLREVDIEKALQRLTKRITEANPPVDLIVVAGDLFHTNTPRPFAIAAAARFVHRLTSLHEGVPPIDVVIVDGNHDSPNRRAAGSPLSFLEQLDAHVINGDDYQTLRNGWHNPRLRGRLIAHCIPYSAITNVEFAGVRPSPGAINILVAHGRVRGMAEINSLHRSVAWIPRDVLRRGWDYAALGDWHQHGHRPLSDAHAYYSGSLEALNFGEAADFPPRKKDPYAVHGALDVRLRAPGAEPLIQTLENDGARAVLRLRPIDAKGLDADELMSQIRTRLQADLPKGALARLEISNVDHHTWSRLEQDDHEELGELRSHVRQCDFRLDFDYPDVGQSSEGFHYATVADQWRDYVEQLVPDEQLREVLYARGWERISAAQQDEQVQLADAGLL